jgi:hypothetical protein
VQELLVSVSRGSFIHRQEGVMAKKKGGPKKKGAKKRGSKKRGPVKAF